MLTLNRAVICSFVFVLVAAPAQAITFTDGDFATGWENIPVVADNPFLNGPNMDGTGLGTSLADTTLTATGGNPGAYRLHTLTVASGDRIYGVGINRNAVYDPASDGPIASMDLSIDLIFNPTGPGANAAQLVLEQGGQLFFSPFLVFSSHSWTSYGLSGLTASDFETTPNTDIATLPGIHPDFSASGAPIFLGYSVGSGVSALTANPVVIVDSADNWAVTVTPVPEPSTALLLGLGLAGVALRRRR